MPKTKKRVTVPNKGGIALAAALKRDGDTMTTAEGRLGFSPGYVSDAIKGTARPSYARRMAIYAIYRVELALWDQDITGKSRAVTT